METKQILFIVGASILVVVLIVSIIFSLRTPKKKAEEGPTAPEPLTLTVWRLYDSEELWKTVFEEFRRDNPHITIKYEKKDPAEYESLFVNAIAGGKGPDIISLPNGWFPKHRDKLVPLSQEVMSAEQFKEQFENVVFEDAVHEGKIYGLPAYVDALALYYNLDILVETIERLRRANPGADLTKERQLLSRPPKTWDDIVSLVKLVTIKSGHNVSLSGLAMGTSETTNNAAAILQALMLQNGAKMINETKTAAAFHLPSTTQTGEPYYPGTEALDFYTSFARPNRATYTWNNKMGSSLEAFMNKKATMMINFQYAQNEIKQRAPTLNFEVAALPQITGATSAVNVASYMIEAVTKTSPRPEEAWKLVKFMTDRQNVSRYQSAARRPSAYRRANEGDTAAFPLGVRTAQSVYKPEEGKFDQYFKEMIRAVVELNQPPQATVEVAANKITDLLQGK